MSKLEHLESELERFIAYREESESNRDEDAYNEAEHIIDRIEYDIFKLKQK